MEEHLAIAKHQSLVLEDLSVKGASPHLKFRSSINFLDLREVPQDAVNKVGFEETASSQRARGMQPKAGRSDEQARRLSTSVHIPVMAVFRCALSVKSASVRYRSDLLFLHLFEFTKPPAYKYSDGIISFRMKPIVKPLQHRVGLYRLYEISNDF